MNLKDIPKEELQSMGYDEIAYLILEKNGKKMKLLDLFKSVSKALDLDEEAVMDHITDFFELLSINKKFVLLENGYWDLAIKHKQEIIVEDDEEETSSEELENDDEDMEDVDAEEDDEDIFYDNDLDNDDDDDDDLKDLVIIDEEEEIS